MNFTQEELDRASDVLRRCAAVAESATDANEEPARSQIIEVVAQAMRAAEETEREACAALAQRYFVGIFTGWKGYSMEDEITLDEAEDAANECGPICAEAIRTRCQSEPIEDGVAA